MESLQAPWIGFGEGDYLRKIGSIVGECERCGRFIRKDDDYYETENGLICEECLSEEEEDGI